MTMLPSASDANSIRHVLIYLVVPDSANLTHISNDLGAIALDVHPLILGHTDPTLSHIRFIVATDSETDLRVISSCDALIAVLDGTTGVGPGTISTWNCARDFDIPRHFAAWGTVNGRVDFDELAAVASRTMEPDLLVRYLPIDADDEDALVGIFDVLTSDIHEVVAQTISIRPSDPEHVSLTADRRDDLFDQLAHMGLDDQALANHRAGLPISISKLETAWSHPDAISITPIENQVGAGVISTWLANLVPHWMPTITYNYETRDVVDTEIRVGIAITESLARMWSAKSDSTIVAWNDFETISVTPDYEDDAVLITSGLTPGMTLSHAPGNCELITPIFE